MLNVLSASNSRYKRKFSQRVQQCSDYILFPHVKVISACGGMRVSTCAYTHVCIIITHAFWGNFVGILT